MDRSNKNNQMYSFIILSFLLMMMPIAIFLFIKLPFYEKDFKAYPAYHFVLMIDEKNDFHVDVKEGCRDAAEQYNITLEVIDISKANEIDMENFLLAAIESGVDGVIASIDGYENIMDIAYKFEKENIPFIVLDERGSGIKDNDYISDNNDLIANEISRIVAEIYPNGTQAIVISELDSYGEKIPNEVSFVHNLGQKLLIHSNTKVCKNLLLKGISVDLSEDILSEIIEHPDCELLICSTTNFALASAQVLERNVDLEHMKIIAVEESDGILEYMMADKITAAVFASGYQLGFDGIVKLRHANDGSVYSSDSENSIVVLMKDSLQQYIIQKQFRENKVEKND